MATNPSSRSTELTPRQAEVLKVIRHHIETTGAPPTRAEIARTLGFRSVNAAEDHLKALAKKGAITLAPGTSRGIKLKTPHGPGIPILNQLKPDNPVLFADNFEGRLQLENSLFNPKPDVLWRIQSNHLSSMGILEGDLLAIHFSTDAQNGQLVFARYNGQPLVRRFKREGSDIVLDCENPNYDTIRISSHNSSAFIIEGVGVGVIRTSCL